jgi:PhnB protein
MGFEITFKADDTEECEFARLRYHNINFTLNKEGSFEYHGVSPHTSHCITPISLYMYHENIDWFFNKVKTHMKVLQEPRNEWWGDKKCRLEDPFGYIWEIATPLK